MNDYVIVGVDTLLNDVFDIIHARGDRVAAIFQNMPEPDVTKGPTISERIAMLDYGVEVYESLQEFGAQSGYRYVQGLNTVHKYRMIEELQDQHNIRFDSLIHPEAHLGSGVKVGQGVFINARAVIAPNAELDDFCSVNRCATVGHDARVGKYSRLGPSVNLAGSTTIGPCCSVGISATVLDYVDVGEWSVVGAGALVTKNIPAGKVAMGVPAKCVRDNEVRSFDDYITRRLSQSGS